MVKIAYDAGHGLHTVGKRSPDDEREWTFNNAVAVAFAAEMAKYENVQLLRTDDSTGKTDVPLATRVRRANEWGADIFISFHHNALAGKWGTHGGVETYVGKSASNASKRLAAIVHPNVVAAMGLRDRGVKTAGYYVLENTRMPAILVEGGFMDSTVDIVAMRNAAKLSAQGIAVAKSVAKFANLTAKTTAAAPVEQSKEGDSELYQPSNDAMMRSTMIVLKRLAAKEGGISAEWADKLAAGELTTSDAIALLYVAFERGLFDAQNTE